MVLYWQLKVTILVHKDKLKSDLDSVISITPVIELCKAKSFLHRDVPDPAIALQELLYVPGGNNG